MGNIMIRSIIASLLFAISLSATVINVPADQTTIQAGIDASVDGDIVIVQPGTYAENINFNGKNIELTSAGGASSTIIQSSSGDAVITGSTDSSAALIGFTISSPGTGINSGPGGSTRFEDLIIQNCGNRGVYLNNYIGTIKNVQIKNNSADFNGGGVHVNSNSDVVFRDVIVSNNTSTAGSGGGGLWIENSVVLFQNTLIYGNSCSEDGGGFYAYNSNVQLINSTITKNTQPSGRYGAGVAVNTGEYSIINSIIYDNGVISSSDLVVYGSSLNASHSCVGLSLSDIENPDGGVVTLWSGPGNINEDPLFMGSEANDFRLSSQSVCLGNGVDTIGVPIQDIIGENRPQPAGSNPDMGAYEHTRGRVPLAVPDRYSTIQAGIDAAVEGDTVLVQPGTYVENINFNGKNIVVGSLFLASQDTSYISQTIIDGNQTGSVITLASGETADAVLVGFTVQNGIYTFGGGVEIAGASPTLRWNVIRENTSTNLGGGISTRGVSHPIIDNCVITFNNCSNAGGGINIDSDATITSSRVTNNTALYGAGVVITSGSPSLQNVLIADNVGNAGGGGVRSFWTAAPLLNRTTVVNNSGGGVFGGDGSHITITNSIVSQNEGFEIGFSNATFSVSYCNVSGGFVGSGNLDVISRFRDSEDGKYNLLASSLCINAGHPDSTDSDGTRADMGAYPYLNSYTGPDWHTTTSGDDILGTGELSNPFASIQAGINFANNHDSVFVEPGTYTENVHFRGHSVLVRGTEGATNTIVDGNASGSVFSVISQEDSTTALEGLTIQNGTGTFLYVNEGNQGTYGGGIYLNDAGLIVKSCVITNNAVTFSGGGIGAYQNQYLRIQNCDVLTNTATLEGGGVVLHSGTSIVNNTRIAQNSSGNGGGLMVYATAAFLTNLRVHDNIALSQGGGIHATFYSDYFLSNSLIYNNTAEWGGGINNHYHLRPTLVNNTVVNNHASSAGGGINFSGLVDGPQTVINSIVYHNTSPTGAQFNSDESEMQIRNSMVQGWETVDSNTSLEPRFVNLAENEFQLLDFSPAIGAGLDTTIAPTTDIDGNPRPNPAGSNPDIGAYENPYGIPQHMPITINIPDDYATIQAGLSAADSTDTVLVQPGTYYENIFWPETNGIKLVSAGDSSNTIIDGGGSGSVITINGSGLSIDSTTVIRGFKIANGTSIFYGGGIAMDSVANPVLEDLLFVNNSAYYGGALSCKQASPIISNVGARNNTATEGGAFYFYDYSSAIISDIAVYYNTASRGGGIFCSEYSHVNIEEASINNNIASVGGGGIFSFNNSHFSLNNSEINFNRCGGADMWELEGGGGIHSEGGSSPYIINSILNGNYTSSYGGGFKGYGSSPTFVNTVFINNTADGRGGGVSNISGNLSITESKFIANTGSMGGAFDVDNVAGSPLISNNIIVDNHATYGGAFRIEQSSVLITQNTISNNTAVLYGDGIYTDDTGANIVQNNFYGNGVGFYFDNDNAPLSIPNNYWGDASGPYHVAYNADGLGDTTSMFTNPTPFLVAPNLIAPPIPIQNVEVTDSGNDFVSVSWESSPLTDLDSYRLYYGTDTTQYTYANSIDLPTLDTSFTIDGLELSSTYYIAVTCIDTADNESWYSNRIEGVTRAILTQNLDIAGDEDLYHLVTHDPLITFEYFDSMGEAQTNYQIQISTDSTFQSNMIWDTGEVASDGTSIQYTEGALQNGVEYYLRARVASGSFWSEWSELAFRMNSMPMPAVNLSLINDEVTQMAAQLTVQRSSDPESDSLSYDLRLYADRALAEPIDSALGLAADGNLVYWQIMTPMLDNERFWWTSQVFDGYEYSEVTGPDSFIVNWNNDIPAEFNLTSPWPGQAITSQSPLFTWDRAIDMDPLDTVRYVLYLDTPEPGTLTFNIDTVTSFQFLDVLEDNTSYHWKVTAHDVAGAMTTNIGGYQSFTVNTSNDLPDDFNLLTPIADMMVTTLTPEFLWEASFDPDDETIVIRSSGKDHKADQSSSGDNSVMVITGYDFYLSTDANLADATSIEVIGTSYIPTEELIENMVYFWAVSALDDSGGVTFSDTTSFWTNAVNEAPIEFVLLTPSHEAEVGVTPTFSWTESSDADLFEEIHYTLQYGPDVFSLTSVESDSLTVFTPSVPLEENTSYVWQVICSDVQGLQYETEFSSFYVNSENDAPTSFSLISPDSSAWLTDNDLMLVWEPSIDLEGSDISYAVSLSMDSESVQPIDTVFSNYYTLYGLEEGYYFWQIEAFDELGGSSTSPVWSFLVNAENDAPNAFNTHEPTDGQLLTTQMVTFTWEPSSAGDAGDQTSYILELGTNVADLMSIYEGPDTLFAYAELLGDNSAYYWQVTAIDLAGATAVNEGGYQSFTVNTSNDLPIAFELLSPVEEMMVTILQPEFLWEASSDPDDETIVIRSSGKDRKADQSRSGDNSVMVITGYDFYLSTDATLADVAPVQVLGTSYTPETDLTENQVYYWAVSALDDSGGVTFSDTSSFWTNSENSSPSELTLLTPVDDTESTMTPTFTWTMSTDADLQDTLNYTLRYGTDVFSLLDIPNGSSSQFTVGEPLEDNTDYIWQVIAEDISGAVFATEFSSFFVNSENDDPGLFSLIAPDSASWITNPDLMLVWEPSIDLEGANVQYVIHMGPDNESLEPVDTISVNYFALNALEDGYYFWQIEALDNNGGTQFTGTWSFLINVNNDPPDPFSLTYPTAEIVLTEQQPIFTWDASSSGDAGDHTSYRMELGTNTEDMGVVYEGDSTHYTPELPLEDNAIYYWQVTAMDMAFATTINEGGYQSFVVNTVNDAPTAAELVSPDSVVVLSDIPTFSWNASIDIDPYDSLNYELHWWTDVAEMDSILTTETSVSPATPLADDNLQYFWNVITMDAHGGIAHSEEKTFWVDFMPEVPASFALLGPDSASAGNGTRPELSWAEAIDPDPFDAVHYSIAIATDSLMENVLYEQVSHIETWMPEVDLENDTRYYWQVTAIDEDSLLTESEIWTFDVGYLATDEFAILPDEFTLKQNYPNPFNPWTTIRYGLPEEANVSLVIYDVRGQIVQTLKSGHQSAGWYDVVWNGQTKDGRTISTGIYFARLVAGDYSQVIKMLYIK